jgi:ABC-type lipoprotein export system ATPase subunit
MVFQHFMLADNLTVLENVVLGAEKLHGIGDEARRTIVEISDAYGLRVDPDDLVAELGVGKRSASRSSRCSTGAPRSSSSTSRPPCSCRRRSPSSSTTCAS